MLKNNPIKIIAVLQINHLAASVKPEETKKRKKKKKSTFAMGKILSLRGLITNLLIRLIS